MITLTPSLQVYASVWVFLLGACIGSFLNVCIYRIPEGQSVVTPRSRCPHCGNPIAWYDNIPLLSWLFLRARCRACGAPIAWRYPLVELLTAVGFLLVWLTYGVHVRTPVYWLVVSGLLLATFVDFDHLIIPDRVSLGGILTGLLLSWAFPSLQDAATHLAGLRASVIGAGTGFGLLFLVAVLGKMAFKKDAMGFGDVKLLGAIGAYLGWRAVLFTIMISSLLGSLVGIGFILARRKEWQSRIPYGPYLALAAVIWIIWGAGWWRLYMNWLTGGMGV